MLDNVKAMIFDMDGTLMDSMWIWPDIDDYYVKKYDLVLPDDFHTAIEGKAYRETAQYFIDVLHMSMDVEAIMKEWTQLAYERYKNDVFLKPGAKELLKYGKEKGIVFGIATSNGRSLVDMVLKERNIQQYFQSVRTSCEVGKGKPSPDVYLKVSEDIGVSPENCLVFEDVPMGILAGKRAGMRVCAIYDKFSEKQDQQKKELADYYIRDFRDVMAGIDGEQKNGE
ncbi:HAD family hydrolase [Sellimonas sp.]|uniref:HAD family hydrolase n=1 Tax=Sellimonas sp. TaxID=2021466 RepID=UPI000B3765D7|nr:HAD family phosphatase [Sellimonas sp.]OUP65915.1 HAD family hydrolase [Drancourtella sp. An177]